MNTLQTLEMALEALENLIPIGPRTAELQQKAITALRQQIALLKQQPADEPHSWYSAQHDEWMTNKTRKEHEELNSYTHKVGGFDLPLYTRPQPAAQWVGLTMEDKKEYVALDYGGNRLDAMDWAEKRLKEKNT